MSSAEARLPRPAGVGSVSPAGSTVSIGEVLHQLRRDFPDVSISKIRFLEAEGLVEPQRSPSGYRRFSHDDIARLRYVLTVQRDHYLPLKVIKEQLAQLDRGVELATDGVSVTPYTVTRGTSESSDVALSRSALIEATAITEELLNEMESYTLVATSRGGTYGAEAVAVARTVGELASYGLQPRHLRAIQGAATREVDLIEQVITPLFRQRGVEARGRAEQMASDVARLMARLHAALVDAGLRRLGSR